MSPRLSLRFRWFRPAPFEPARPPAGAPAGARERAAAS